jgi:hypothetical protein
MKIKDKHFFLFWKLLTKSTNAIPAEVINSLLKCFYFILRKCLVLLKPANLNSNQVNCK